MLLKPLIAATVLLHLTATSVAIIRDSISALPKTTYDFIIVGGGTAGCVLANRLTENPRHNVLVIEAGPIHEGILSSMVPGYAFSIQNSPYDWNYTTVPQKGLHNRSIAQPRGHILGGSSSISCVTRYRSLDVMAYTRGSSSDYDRWAAVTGDAGWSWKKLLPYIFKHERWTHPADNRNVTGDYNPKVHSRTGMTSVSLFGFPDATGPKVRQAADELGGEFAYNIDSNSGDPLGTGWLQLTVGNGQRSSAATSYLGPKYIDRKNLHVLVNNRALKLLKSGSHKGVPEFRTVSFVEVSNSSGNNNTHTITAKKEVILSAGVYGSPQLLMLSGIGDSAELQSLGIQPTLHLPSVGKNLSDHTLLALTWELGINGTFDPAADPTLSGRWLEEWRVNRTGPLTGVNITSITWTRLPDDSPIYDRFSDPSAGKNTPQIEVIIAGSGYYPKPGPRIVTTIISTTPHSRGSISLKSSNPLDDPLIDLGLLTSEFDMFAMREAVRTPRRFFSAPTWEEYRLTLVSPFPSSSASPSSSPLNLDDDAALDNAIRGLASSGAHPVGTVAMSALGARFGVRVVDASVMPFVTSGHTQAPVYAIAERAADLIKGSW